MSDEDFDLPTDVPTNVDLNNNNETEKSPTTGAPFIKKVMHALNLIGYIAILSTYLHATYSDTGINGVTESELMDTHPTLLTPNYKSTKVIWGFIFFTQGVFVVAQLLVPRCRDHILLVEGIGPMYILACVAQVVWYATFAYDLLITSFVFLVGVFVCVVGLLARQHQTMTVESNNNLDMIVPGTSIQMKEGFSPDDGYWLLRFPFGMYAGWIASMVPLMLSIVLASFEADATTLVWVAVMGVALLTGLSMGMILRKEYGLPSYSLPSVVAFYFCGLRAELEWPNDYILALYDEAYLSLMKNVSALAAVMLLVTTISRFIAVYLRDRCTKKEKNDDAYDATGLDGVDYVQA
jgi:lysylphosphatidylglycerol synthetase-like protein (DUF2156 family)